MYAFLVGGGSPQNRQPLGLIPPQMARAMLNAQRAAVLNRFPFTLVRRDSDPLALPPGTYRIKIDPGSSHTGLAVTQTADGVERVLWAAVIEHRRKAIVQSLIDRSKSRRNRRNRKTRYRQARFDNRGRPSGWLPPSTESVLANIITTCERIVARCPVSDIDIEQPKFDPHKAWNPRVSGKDYQEGPLKGVKKPRHYLFNHYRECAYCGATGGRLEADHIRSRAEAGSNKVSNRCLACRECNVRKGKLPVEEFLADRPDRLKKIQTLLDMPSLSGMAVMNSIRAILPQRLADLFEGVLKVNTYPPALTVLNRDRFFSGHKDHWIDAACVGDVGELTLSIKSVLEIRAAGHGSRQRVLTDKHGFPRRKKDGEKAKHKPRRKKFFGYQTGDIVRVKRKGEREAVGRVSGTRSTGQFAIQVPGTKVFNLTYKSLKPVHKNDGYSYQAIPIPEEVLRAASEAKTETA